MKRPNKSWKSGEAIGVTRGDGADEEHICVFHAFAHKGGRGFVGIHSDKACVYLTPDEALEWATEIARAANEAAEEEITA